MNRPCFVLCCPPKEGWIPFLVKPSSSIINFFIRMNFPCRRTDKNTDYRFPIRSKYLQGWRMTRLIKFAVISYSAMLGMLMFPLSDYFFSQSDGVLGPRAPTNPWESLERPTRLKGGIEKKRESHLHGWSILPTRLHPYPRSTIVECRVQAGLIPSTRKTSVIFFGKAKDVSSL